MVHPSIADIEGVSVLEGMACGLVPVIAGSRLSAAGNFALTGNSLFPSGDSETLALRIDWWIEHPEDRRIWGRKYAEYACRHYTRSDQRCPGKRPAAARLKSTVKAENPVYDMLIYCVH